MCIKYEELQKISEKILLDEVQLKYYKSLCAQMW